MSGSSVEQLNEIQAKMIIAELVRCNTEQFVIAPGSRSTPLVLAALDNPIAKTTVHFDERSAGFYAYGIAKASRNPVCVIVTSGTALANLAPAVSEAEKDQVPLIILSADRPSELHDCGANQTMKQEVFFDAIVKDSFNVYPTDEKIIAKSLPRRIDQACYRAARAPMGPIHINVMIREPFFTKTQKNHTNQTFYPLPATRYQTSESSLPKTIRETISAEFSKTEKGLIIVGELSNDVAIEEILSLAMKLQWPVFADTSSGLRSLGRDSTLIPFYNHILQTTFSKDKMIPELILYFGGHVVSKPLSAWVSSVKSNKFYHVINSPFSKDSIHAITDHIELREDVFCREIFGDCQRRPPSYWLSLWKEYSLHTEEIIQSFIEDCPELNEPYTVFSLVNKSLIDVDLFFSNSLPVRYADSFLFPEQETGWTYTKRGLSGIDGVLSMAIGICEHTQKRLICFIGDMAFMYDLTALTLLKERNLPITIVLLNNGGGGIFQFLPIAQRKKECAKYWIQKHKRTFDQHVNAFGIEYKYAKNKAEYDEMLSSSLEEKGPAIIEVRTSSEENFVLHQQIEEHLKKKMMRSKKEKELCYFSSKST